MINNDEIIIDDNIINENKPQIQEKNENSLINEKESKENKIEKDELEISENLNENNQDKININTKNENINNMNTNDCNKSEDDSNKVIQHIDSLGQKENKKEQIISDKNDNSKNLNDIDDINLNNNIDKTEQKDNLISQNINPNNNFNELKKALEEKKEKNENNIDIFEEYNKLNNIINNNEKFINQRNINIFNNKKNQLYFTEINVEEFKSKNNQKPDNITSSIPEQLGNPNKSLTIQIGEQSFKSIKNNINFQLNNLSPKIYMKKKFVNKYNFHPLQFRIKKIEEEIEKQNKYDYQRVMKDLQLKYEKEKKTKEKEKHIFELHKKLEEKLKFMEEKRNILYNKKLEQITKKQNKSNKKNRNKTKTNKSYENKNLNSKPIDTFNYNSEKEGKLPLLQNLNLPRHEIVKLLKIKKEEEFCFNTIKRLKENEITHRKNYLKQINIINNKILEHNKLYKQRSENCLISNKNKAAKLEEIFLEKDIMRRYNIKQIISRERSAKKIKINGIMIKNKEEVKEKKELLEKEEKKKIDQIVKKLNKEIKKEINEKKERDHFSILQKENYDKCNKEIDNYYNELILKRGENLLIINDLQKDEQNEKQEIIKKSLKEQNKKNIKLRYLENYIEKMDKNNINNQSEGTKRKIFLNKRRIEERIKKEQEEDLLYQ